MINLPYNKEGLSMSTVHCLLSLIHECGIICIGYVIGYV